MERKNRYIAPNIKPKLSKCVHYLIMMIACGILSVMFHIMYAMAVLQAKHPHLSLYYYMRTNTLIVFLAMLFSLALYLLFYQKPNYFLLYFPAILVIILHVVSGFLTSTSHLHSNFSFSSTISLYGILPLGVAVLILVIMFGHDQNKD